jgi:hypothetical protein
MYRELINIFINTSETFVRNEQALILSGVSERCLCGSLMLILRRELDLTEFRAYNCDIEYNRNFDGRIKTIIDDHSHVVNITCDLIVHSRGRLPRQDNLIAIEMKRDSHEELEKNKDRMRLRALTKPTNDEMTYSDDGRTLPENVCGYILGVFYEVSVGRREINIEYYRNGEFYKSFTKRI